MSSQQLFFVPIEPLEERYTKEWYDNFPRIFHEAGFAVTTIDGEQLSTSITTGAFLDMNDTIVYKNAQMSKIAHLFKTKAIRPGAIFFIADIEFWGIEALRLISQLNQVPIKIFGFLHAASYTAEDAFSVATPYQKYTELGWLAACDGVFVGSKYHKQAVIERRILPYADEKDKLGLIRKIHVTGNPLFESEDTTEGWIKRKKLVITNRFDYEKRPNLSLQFAYLLKKRNKDLDIVITTSRPEFRSNQKWLVDLARGMEEDGILTIEEGITKKQYHNHLKTARVMLTNSIEENFGYCIAEALRYNCAPLMPNHCSHPEFVDGDERFLFNNNDEVIPKAEALLETTDKHLFRYIERFYHAPRAMINVMVTSDEWY